MPQQRPLVHSLTTMKERRLLFAFWMATSMALALDIVITGTIRCQELPVTMTITSFCNEDSTCSFGSSEYISTKMNYHNLNATGDDILIISASLQFSFSGYVTYDKSILEEPAEIQVCGENNRRNLQQEEDNDAPAEDTNDEDEQNAMDAENGRCPENSSYRSFGTDVTFPNPPNDFFGWAASGYKGDIVFYIYVGSTSAMVGHCSQGIQTFRSQSEQENGFLKSVPSGKRTAVIILLTFCSLVILWILFCLRHRRKVLPAKEPLLMDFDKEKQDGNDNDNAPPF